MVYINALFLRVTNCNLFAASPIWVWSLVRAVLFFLPYNPIITKGRSYQLNWNYFHEEICKSEIQDTVATEKEAIMAPLFHAFVLNDYYERRFSDIDFNSFTYDQVKLAFEESMLLTLADVDYGEEAEENRGNLIVEINRIGHLKKIMNELPSSNSKKKRFI